MGPPWGPEVPLKVRNTRLGHKSTFSEKFRGIMKIGSENFWSRIWSTSVLGFLHRFEIIRSTGGRGSAESGPGLARKTSMLRNNCAMYRILAIAFFGLQVPRMRTAQYLRKALYPRNILRVPVALFRVRRNLSILATPEVQKQS